MDSDAGGGLRIVHDYKRTKDSIIRLIELLNQTLMNVSTLQDVANSVGISGHHAGRLREIVTRDIITLITTMVRVIHAMYTLSHDVSKAIAASKEKDT